MALTWCIGLALLPLPASAQETVKELASKASAELRLLSSLQTLERMTSQVNHYLVYGIEAERGGWRVLEKEVSNDYALHSIAHRAQLEIVRVNNSIQRNKAATEDELKGADSAVENLEVLLGLTPQIADLISTKELDAAAALYREIGQSAHDKAIRGAQSSIATVQSRLSKTLLGIRTAN